MTHASAENSSRNVQNLLQSTQTLLTTIQTKLSESNKPSHYQPVRKLIAVHVLVPEGFEEKELLLNSYGPLPVGIVLAPDWTVIVHGHKKGVPCYSSYFCHVAEYKPTGAEPPGFLKLWRDKWEKSSTSQTSPQFQTVF